MAVTAFQRALRECARWGVRVRLLSQDSGVTAAARHHRSAPLHRGCIDNNGQILWWDLQEDGYKAAGLLHEMAHVVVWRELSEDPEDVFELDVMLAIEAEANRRIRSDWKTWMGYYQLDDGTEWGSASTHARHRWLVKSSNNAHAMGLMHRGKPTYKCTRRIKNGKVVNP